MQNYIVVHYAETEPQVIGVDTFEAARLCVLGLVADPANNPMDIIAVIDFAAQETLYYGRGKKLAALLGRVGRAKALSRRKDVFSLTYFMRWVRFKLIPEHEL